MALFARLVRAPLAAAVLILVAAQPAAACSGQDATLRAGVHGARSIYFARIVELHDAGNGFYRLTLDVGQVFRGRPQTHVAKMINAEVCNALGVGDSGLVVLGSIGTFGDGPGATYNLFFVHASRAEVAATLSVPETDAALPAPHERAPSASPIFPAITVGSFALMVGLLHVRGKRRAA
jgi:hypothetical protein